MKIILRSFLFLLFCGLPVSAQEADEEKPKTPAGRLAWFVATSIPDDLENPVTVMTGQDFNPVTLSKRMVSNPVKIPADGVIRLVREGPDPADPAKSVYLTLAQAAIPEGMREALIVLIPSVKKEGSSQVFRTEVRDLATFKGGDWLYLNLTKLNIAVELGKDKLMIKPGETRIFSAPAMKESTNIATRYSFFHPTHEKWRMLSASTIVLRPTRREICIFGWDPRFERVDYHGVTFPVTQ